LFLVVSLFALLPAWIRNLFQHENTSKQKETTSNEEKDIRDEAFQAIVNGNKTKICIQITESLNVQFRSIDLC
jgi:hypothetical protein